MEKDMGEKKILDDFKERKYFRLLNWDIRQDGIALLVI